MPNYDKTDLTSTLNYIKSEYGLNPFKDGKIIAFLSDLAPSLKREKSLLKKLVDKGLMKEIAENASSDDITQRRIIFKTKTFLIDEECIQPEKAEKIITVLIDVFHFNVKLQQQSQKEENTVTPDLQAQTVSNPSSNLTSYTDNEIKNLSKDGNDNNIDSDFCDNNANSTISQQIANGETLKKFIETIRNSIGLEMVFCPAGSFVMGSSIYEIGRSSDENQYKVTIGRGYLIGKHPVTQKLYEAVMGSNPSNFRDENNPVECISWNDAKDFCNKLNKIYVSLLPRGYLFALPTEAQWEYACRAGTTAALNNGKDLTGNLSCYNLDEVGWYAHNSYSKTHPVGQKKPNAWGIYDMHGNVYEWCRDFYGNYPTGNVIDPVGADIYSSRVIRGGSWNHDAMFCRSARRFYSYPDCRCNDLGFRIALVPILDVTPYLYDKYLEEMKTASTEEAFIDLAEKFHKISDYKDSKELELKCKEEADKIKIKIENAFNEIMSNMVNCSAGKFRMGSTEPVYGNIKDGFWNSVFGMREIIKNGEFGRNDGEIPHEVTISKNFKISRYLVTQKIYEIITGNNPSGFKGDDNPVENVTWYDAKAFCDKLNIRFASKLPNGYKFDLPTEAQWEYACRAGTISALNNGKDLTSEYGVCLNLNEVAWYDKNSDSKTHPVGQKRPNAWGIYDMHGNVCEWCRDEWFTYTSGSVIDPIGANNNSHIYRGGGWNSSAHSCRSARRDCNFLNSCNDLGFRLALVPIQ